VNSTKTLPVFSAGKTPQVDLDVEKHRGIGSISA